ncbi:MAG TPA: phosphoenolpyruvate--protein phosphotransferase [Ignavibacteriaceae bacterium]|nr:phosphoenolpyruvate--protein phosphotransferase [Ignavibacteriaceae bacterium]
MKNFKHIYKEAQNKVQGIAAAPGIVIGKVYLFTKEKLEVADGDIVDVAEAKQNLKDAIKQSKKELTKVFSIAREKMGEARAAIFEAQMMILDDPVLLEAIEKRIETEKKLPEFIVFDEISKYQDIMKHSAGSYIKERAHDIDDIKNRIIRNLQKKRWQSKIVHDSIVVSDMLTPADTLLLSRSNVKGFVTDHGGLTSHAAIISRSLNIPAVVGTHNITKQVAEGDTIIVDGFHGYVLINPTDEQTKFFTEKFEHLVQLQKGLEEYKDKPAITLDGREILLNANVDVSGEIDIVVASGSSGIGLYRTEQILEEMSEFPTEEEQVKIYSNLSSRIYPKILTIRAFDIGGDKFKLLDYTESNPFLGLRGIRLLLENLNLFKTQIKAVLRASHNKNIQFMLPMISTITEIRKSKEIIEECKSELKKEKHQFDNHIKIGIMVEVPAAAVMTREFAHEVDFLSIGTNDLIQYLMAVDRGNDLVSGLYQEFSPAVIRTLHHIITEGNKAKKEISFCGEMAADTLAIPLLVGLGYKSLSMSPSTIPYAKRIIRHLNYEATKKLAVECLECCIETEITNKVEKFFKDYSITRTRQII